MKYDVIVIGAGAAGISAAIYLARAKLKTLVLGTQKDSQLISAYDVENYFGFENGTTGRHLLRAAKKQLKKAGASIIEKKVEKIEEIKDLFRVYISKKEAYEAEYLIIACGMLASLEFAESLNLKTNSKRIVVDTENQTSHQKVYAAGNCCTLTRQIAKDVGDGCHAAINIIKKIKKLNNYTDYGPVE